MQSIKSQLVRIGNSRGVRFPKALIEQAGLPENVELRVRGNTIVVSAGRLPREGWAEAAQRLAADQSEPPADAPTPTRFDEADWQW